MARPSGRFYQTIAFTRGASVSFRECSGGRLDDRKQTKLRWETTSRNSAALLCSDEKRQYEGYVSSWEMFVLLLRVNENQRMQDQRDEASMGLLENRTR